MAKAKRERLPVRKMYKLFIGGDFVRSESARSDALWDGLEFAGNIARASRKDVRDAVVAARRAQPTWWQTPPGTRGLILYRLAEMLEARKAEFALILDDRQIDAAIDRTLWYAGWCDKYNALLSSRNPVGGRHLNFSTAEPQGVVAVLSPDEPSLLALVSTLLPAVVGGNGVVAVASEKEPRSAILFAEAVATCDMPAGLINVLTGYRSELGPVLAKHMDVNAIAFQASSNTAELERFSAENVKRAHILEKRETRDWYASGAQRLDDIAAFCEIKTIWHPAGI